MLLYFILLFFSLLWLEVVWRSGLCYYLLSLNVCLSVLLSSCLHFHDRILVYNSFLSIYVCLSLTYTLILKDRHRKEKTDHTSNRQKLTATDRQHRTDRRSGDLLTIIMRRWWMFRNGEWKEKAIRWQETRSWVWQHPSRRRKRRRKRRRRRRRKRRSKRIPGWCDNARRRFISVKWRKNGNEV